MADHGNLTAGELQRVLGISRPRLRRWEAQGIISPIMTKHQSRLWREYPPQEVSKVRSLLYLLSEGMTLRGAIAKLPAWTLVEEKRASEQAQREAAERKEAEAAASEEGTTLDF